MRSGQAGVELTHCSEEGGTGLGSSESVGLWGNKEGRKLLYSVQQFLSIRLGTGENLLEQKSQVTFSLAPKMPIHVMAS
ncbi:hypothetical protein [Paenibacillus andongensis]|uniref:hypothetical protein n=1 Tax=Paenibacillus andongensis TaxID=2975482 RepID=UPI0021BA4BBC|nr:hypothetical protein [Paenibacillus andongensis]